MYRELPSGFVSSSFADSGSNTLICSRQMVITFASIARISAMTVEQFRRAASSAAMLSADGASFGGAGVDVDVRPTGESAR